MQLDYQPKIEKPVSPLKELIFLSIPTVLQMSAYTIEQFIDAWMLSSVSDLHATACVNSGMLSFCVISFGFGILMLINAMVSHAYGAKKFEDCGKYLWQGVWIALVYSVAVFPLIFVSEWMFKMMGHPVELIPLEVSYFKISVALVVIKMLAVAFGQFMLAVNRPNVVLVAATAGMVVNIIVNYFLIYGNHGFPRLGIDGAAWGTNAAVTTELLIVACVTFSIAMRGKYQTLKIGFDKGKFKEILKVGLPSGFQVTGDVFAWTLFLGKVMAIFGPVAMAANSYMIQYMKIAFMPAFGIGTAVTALVARYLGARQPEQSENRAALGFKLATIYMISCGLIFLIFRTQLISLFTNNPEVIRVGGILMIISAIYQLFDAMFIVYISALRGVKDTFIPTTVQICLCWGLVVGGGWAVAYFFPNFGVVGPWTIAMLYGMILGFYLLARFKSGKWKKLEPNEEVNEFDPVIQAAVEPMSK